MGALESGFDKRLRDTEGAAIVGVFIAALALILSLSLAIALGCNGVFTVTDEVRAASTLLRVQESEQDELKYAITMLENRLGKKPTAEVYLGTDGTSYVLVDKVLYKTLVVPTKPVEDEIEIGQD